MQKISNGRGRSRKLWPNVRYADTLLIKYGFKIVLGIIKFSACFTSVKVIFGMLIWIFVNAFRERHTKKTFVMLL